MRLLLEREETQGRALSQVGRTRETVIDIPCLQELGNANEDPSDGAILVEEPVRVGPKHRCRVSTTAPAAATAATAAVVLVTALALVSAATTALAILVVGFV